MGIEALAQTHPGRVRKHNEDVYAVESELGLFVVADGMGGVDAGEVASALARDTLVDAVRSGMGLEEGVQQAHQAIVAAADRGVGARGMGTTVVAARVRDGEYELAWVGDSRCYGWSGTTGTLSRLTRDHSQVEMLLERGLITEEQAHKHPQKNLITQALGQAGAPRLVVGQARGALLPGNSLLLCSDGLNDELTDLEIATELAASGRLDVAAGRLVEAALARGGRDNITVLLIRAGGIGWRQRHGALLWTLAGIASACAVLGWFKFAT